jgi:phage gpG-like protein
MTLEGFQNYLKELEKEFQELYSKVAPRAAGSIAVRLFERNFENEGFFGKRWKTVKRLRKTKKGSDKNRRGVKGSSGKTETRRKILAGKTGDLRRSISFKADDSGETTIFTNPESFESKEPYGRVHNEGLRAGRGKGFTMPKRQFAGDHPELRKAIIMEIEKKIKEIVNK